MQLKRVKCIPCQIFCLDTLQGAGPLSKRTRTAETPRSVQAVKRTAQLDTGSQLVKMLR